MKNTIYLLVLFSFASLKSEAQTILDIDSNSYNTVVIGTQTWMQENLKTTRFNNGILIPTTSLPIFNDTTMLFQWPYNDDTTYINIYGRLYTWNIARGSDNVCPVGWKVPNKSDWDTLSNFLGGDSIAGGKMKEIGTAHWLITDSTVDNSSGFTGLGGGFRGNPSGFRNLGSNGSFWSSTPFGTNGIYPRGFGYSLFSNTSTLSSSVAVGNNGKSIRCIKEVTASIDNTSFKNKIQLFPNPAKDRVIISLEELRNYQLSIYDLLGKSLYQQKLVDKINYLDITFLPRGTYLIQLIAEDHVVSYKFIKH